MHVYPEGLIPVPAHAWSFLELVSAPLAIDHFVWLSHVHGTVFLPTSLHQLLCRLSRDNLRRFYLLNLSQHFKLLSLICVPVAFISTLCCCCCCCYCYWTVKYKAYSSSISPQDITGHIWHLQCCLLLAFTPAKAATRFSDIGGLRSWGDLRHIPR